MSFDALTLSAVRDELEPLLVDARLQKVVFVDELSLAVECFAPGAGRTNVLLSANLEHGRIHRIAQLPVRGLERDSPFSLLIRKHLRNARVRAIHQPRLERVFELDCEQRDASGRLYRVVLIVEAMGRRSNLVLLEADGTILDAARRTPPSRNPRRPVLPHLPYAPPPAQERLLPEDISAETLRSPASGRAKTLAAHLGERIAGLSPLAGRELAFRATGHSDAPLDSVDWPRVAAAAREFLGMVETHAWQPTLAADGERPLEYAPYALTHLTAGGATLLSFASISEAIATFYARLAESGPARRGDPLAAERKALLPPIERAERAVERRIAALEHQLVTGQSERDPLRRAGEAILAHQTQLAPGATELTLDGERIALDERLSASENAQAYFARYRKAREAEERVPALLAEAHNQQNHLAELRTLVEVADQMDAIRALRREVAAATSARASREATADGNARRGSAAKRSTASAAYRRVALAEGWEALVGTSAAGNAAVTFEVADAEDLWLHARGVPGAHVILRTRGASPPDAVIERAAQLAAAHSSARAASAIEVDVTRRRYVKKIPGAAPGLVRYTNERTVRVTPRAL